MKHGKLIVCKAGDAASATGKPFPSCLITRASGDQHRFNTADRKAYAAVKAQWQNIQRAKHREIIGDDNTRFERRTTVTKLGKKSKRTKLAAIQQKGIEPSASNVKVLRHIYASEATALQGAKAAWQKLQHGAAWRGVAEFSITLAHGQPEIFPELPAKASGFKPTIDGSTWLISKATHNIADGGFTTAIELEMRLEDLAS